MRRAFGCSLQRVSLAFSFQTSLFSKKSSLISNQTSLFSKQSSLISNQTPSPFQYHHKLKEAFITLTDPSSANPRHCVIVTHCFTRQPSTFSQLFPQKSEGISHLLPITTDFSVFFFFLFFWLFDVWVFAVVMSFQHMVMKVCFSAFFSLFDVWVSIWFDLLKSVVMGFQLVVTLFFSVFLFSFFFFVWCLGKHLIWSTGFPWLLVFYFLLFIYLFMGFVNHAWFYCHCVLGMTMFIQSAINI